MLNKQENEIDSMVFSDCSSDTPQHDTKNGLAYISECNESLECGNNECENSKNLDLLNQQVLLAQQSESSQTACSG